VFTGERGKASTERKATGIFRLRVPTRFARRHASLKMTVVGDGAAASLPICHRLTQSLLGVGLPVSAFEADED